MNRPNLAWRNHCIFSSCDLGPGSGLDWASIAPAQSAASAARPMIFSEMIRRTLSFMGELLLELLFPHTYRVNSSGSVQHKIIDGPLYRRQRLCRRLGLAFFV